MSAVQIFLRLRPRHDVGDVGRLQLWLQLQLLWQLLLLSGSCAQQCTGRCCCYIWLLCVVVYRTLLLLLYLAVVCSSVQDVVVVVISGCCVQQCTGRCCCSELLEISHIRTIYHIFVAILIVFMLNTFVSDIMERGRFVSVSLSLCVSVCMTLCLCLSASVAVCTHFPTVHILCKVK